MQGQKKNVKRTLLRARQKTSQRGVYIVEFAIVAGVFFFMMFGAIEVSRLLYTWSALDAITQRGARVAAVCPLNDPAVAQVAIFGEASSSGSSIVLGVTTANIGVRYLNAAGNPVANRANVSLVEVSIQNYTHQMLIPETIANFTAPLLTAPPFTTTRPAESLGRNPGGADFC